MARIIEVTGLYKSYGNVHAVNGIDFYVEAGTLFAFLGPNGAGKSTTVDILCTFLQPDKGEVTIDGLILGRDDVAIRSIIGTVFQDHLLDPLLTVEENLQVRGGFYGHSRARLKEVVAAAVQEAGVTEFVKRPYGKLSGGQRRRADIARALVHTPKVLFLDEPTTGLDPQTRQGVWKTISTLQREKGVTVFLTTHYLEEASAADYVVVLDHGVIAAKGTPSQLRDEYASDLLHLYFTERAALHELLTNQGISYTEQGDHLSIKLEHTLDALPILEKCRSYISGFEVVSGTMDDAFISITGKEIRE